MSIKTRLTLTIVALILLPVLLIGSISYWYVRHTVLKDKTHEMSANIDREIDIIYEHINNFVALVNVTKEFPPIQGIVRTRDSRKDPVDGSTYEDWKFRLETIFSSQLEHFKEVFQLRYLDENGMEMVKVIRNSEKIVVTSEDELQDKSNRYYFKELQKLKDQQIYISPVDLNVEKGMIQVPHVPTMRLGVPVFSETDGSRKGYILLNVDFRNLFELLQDAALGESIIIDHRGYFLLHPDKSKEFGRQLGTGHNYFSEQPELVVNIKKLQTRTHYDAQEKEFRTWKKVFYMPERKDQYMVVFERVKEKKVLGPYNDLGRKTVLISGVAAVLVTIIAWMFSVSITSPIVELGEIAKRVEKGDLTFKLSKNLKNKKDEIGLLAASIENMAGKLIESNISLDRKVKESTQELEQNIKELQRINDSMIGRELKMIELKKEIASLKEQLQSKG